MIIKLPLYTTCTATVHSFIIIIIIIIIIIVYVPGGRGARVLGGTSCTGLLCCARCCGCCSLGTGWLWSWSKTYLVLLLFLGCWCCWRIFHCRTLYTHIPDGGLHILLGHAVGFLCGCHTLCMSWFGVFSWSVFFFTGSIIDLALMVLAWGLVSFFN